MPVAARQSTSRLDRSRLIDVVVVAVTLTIGFAFLAVVVAETDPPRDEIVVQAAVGVAATLTLWWRRRWPLAVALLMVPLSFLSSMVQIAGLVAVFTVAVWRPAGVAVAAAVAFWLPTLVLHGIESDADTSYLAAVLFSATLSAAAMGWGMFVRARRQLLASLRERAHRAEAEQHERVSRAQQAERTRIAREMHDVLGHRLSLLGMHAGALEYRPDASPSELAAAAGTVREQARLALRDLREIVGVLRDGSEEPTTPQPTLADLPELVAESTTAGMRVDAHLDVADAPNPTGRHAYRIVQEALTNARRHAPGEVVVLRVEGDATRGITITTTNAVVDGSRDDGAASGLVGMAERARLVGGRLEHGRSGDGRYTLTAWLPWST